MIKEGIQFTRLTMEQPNLKVTWEVPYIDVNMGDMFDAFKTILVGMTFLPSHAEEGVNEFKEEINEAD